MTTTVTNAVAAKSDGPGALVARYSADFAAVLPSHVRPETWVRLAQGVLRRDPKLAEAAAANPGSLLTALLDAARQGLEPGTEQFYLVPFKNKGRLEVQGIRGYQGEVELIYRAGAVSSIVVKAVRANDRFDYRPGVTDRPVHEPDWFGERGELIGVYAYAVMKDGATSNVVILNRDDIARIKRSSQSAGSEHSPWRNHEEAMYLKSAARQLRKWVPTSAEYRREQMRAAAEYSKAASAHDLPERPPSEYVDGEVVPEADWPEVAEPGGGE